MKSICCGLDVHKIYLYAAIRYEHKDEKQTYVEEVFRRDNEGLKQLADWLIENHCYQICMESTGKLWYPIFDDLEKYGIICDIANPACFKSAGRVKTDKRDAQHIADIYAGNLAQTSYVPSKYFRDARALIRNREKYIGERTEHKNRYNDLLVQAHIYLKNVLSSVYGKFARNVISILLKKGSITLEEIEACKSPTTQLGCSVEDVYKAVSNPDFNDLLLFMLHEEDEIIKALDKKIDRIDKKLKSYLEPYDDVINRLTEIDGIGEDSARAIIAEIGSKEDLQAFDDVKSFLSWCGVVPRVKASGGKEKSNRCPKVGGTLRPTIMKCAMAAVKKKGGYFAIKYNLLTPRMKKIKALVAVAKEMLICIYFMIMREEHFNPVDYEKVCGKKPPFFENND